MYTKKRDTESVLFQKFLACVLKWHYSTENLRGNYKGIQQQPQPCKLGINSRAREGCPLSRKNGKSKDNINKWKEPWPMNSTCCSLLDSLKNSQVHDGELSKGKFEI